MSRPKWLTQPDGLSERALKLWKALAPGYYRDGVLTTATSETFRQMVRALAISDVAEAEIERDGITIQTNSGTRRPHPAVAVLFSAQKEAGRLAKELGLDDPIGRHFRA